MILERLFLVTALVGSILALMNVIGANVYDIRAVKKQRQLAVHPHSRRYRQRPLISVIVPTRNDERRIELCLNGILRSSYRKLEIIVIDADSHDKTKNIVKNFISDHPKRNIRLIAKRTSNNGFGAVATGYKKYGQGELIMLCEAGSILDKHALSNAVKHFNTESNVGVISFKRSVESAFSTVGLFQKYENLLRYRSEKFTSVSNSDYAASGEGAIYRRDVFLNSSSSRLSVARPGNKNVRSYYASDVVAYTEPLPSFYALLKQRYRLQLSRLQALRDQRQLIFTRDSDYTKFLTWFRLPFAICVGAVSLFVPILLSYFIYMAVELHEPTLLILSWVILGIFLLFAVWGDEQLKLRQKAAYSAFIPITYGLFYVMSFVQIFVILKGVMPRKLFLYHSA
jgi:cellulose synthase/poly-beta-1,6-N-acetylglucosamine synthase-like glycosyltransferase